MYSTGGFSSGKGRNRRTVLQLGSDTKKKSYLSRYGYNRSEEAENGGAAAAAEPPEEGDQLTQKGLSLLNQYKDSDDESSEDDSIKESEKAEKADDEGNEEECIDGQPLETLPQTKEDPTPPEEVKEPVSKPPSKPPRDSIDTEVASFLAEIQAISEPTGGDDRVTPPIDGDVTPPMDTSDKAKGISSYKQFVKGTPQLPEKTNNPEKEKKAEEEKEMVLKEPQSVWERCLDEGSTYHYYWHTLTNKVTWEIPPEYTQYLLLVREFEEKVERYKKEGKKYLIIKEGEEDKSEGKKEKKKKDSSQKKVEVSKPKAPSGPPTPKIEKAEKKVETPEVNGHEELENPKEESPSERHRSHRDRERHKKKKKKHRRDEKYDSEGSSHGHRHSRRREKHRSRHDHSKERSRSKEHKSPDKKSECDVEVDIDVDDIDMALEMALEEKLDKKEDQDNEKQNEEMSSEQKPNKKSKHRHPRDNEDKDKEPVKKKAKLVDYVAGDSDSDPPDNNEEIAEEGKKNEEEKEQSESFKKPDKLHILDMAELSLSKLEFLEVTKKGLSKLQLILVEIETRYQDWQCGKLDSDYFLTKLHLVDKQLEQYEQSAAPTGWACSWSRPYRRYFYTNNVSGESQWDYPKAAGRGSGEADELPHPVGPPPSLRNDSSQRLIAEADKVSSSGLSASNTSCTNASADTTTIILPAIHQVVSSTGPENTQHPGQEHIITASQPQVAPNRLPEYFYPGLLQPPPPPPPPQPSSTDDRQDMSDGEVIDEPLVEGPSLEGRDDHVQSSFHSDVQSSVPETVGSSQPHIIDESSQSTVSSERSAPRSPEKSDDDSDMQLDSDIPLAKSPQDPKSSDNINEDSHSLDDNLMDVVQSSSSTQNIDTEESQESAMAAAKIAYLSRKIKGKPKETSQISELGVPYRKIETFDEPYKKAPAKKFNAAEIAASYLSRSREASAAKSKANDSVLKSEPMYINHDKSQAAESQDAGPSVKTEPVDEEKCDSPVAEKTEGNDNKKKKKDKLSGAISLKKKGVSSLVQKWQKVKKEVELEEEIEEKRQQEIRSKLEEWKKDNP